MWKKERRDTNGIKIICVCRRKFCPLLRIVES
jgi:hypothetical protein